MAHTNNSGSTLMRDSPRFLVSLTRAAGACAFLIGRWMMRNPDAKHLDFADLVGLIPTNPKLLPSNLDMVYERRGHFLLCEWKREGEQVSKGQEILLRALAAQPSFIVLVVTGDTDAGMRVSGVAQLHPDGSLKPKGDDVDDLKGLISRWYLWVEMKCGGVYAASL